MKQLNSNLLIICSLFAIYSSAQSNKISLQPTDYENWRTIENVEFSNNGQFVAYELDPQQGDGCLILNEIKAERKDTFKLGATPYFTADSRFLIYRIKVPFDKMKKAQKKKVKEEKMPLDSVVIYNLKSMTENRYHNLLSWKFPEKTTDWGVFLQRPDSLEKTEDDIKLSNLILYRFTTGDTILVKGVTEYNYAKNGQAIIYSCTGRDSSKISKLFLFNTNTGHSSNVFEKKGTIKKLTLNENGDEYAFLFSQDTTKEKTYSLFLGKSSGKFPELIADRSTSGIPIGWSPNENREMFFTKDGSRIFFGTKEIPKPEEKDSLSEKDKPVLDIWSWNDKVIMPQQKVNLDKEKKRTYLAVYEINKKRMTQLADPNIREILLTMDGDGDLALGEDVNPYLLSESWTGRNAADYYVFDIPHQQKNPILKNAVNARLSPKGKYLIWFNPSDSAYFVRSTSDLTKEAYPVTKRIPVNFYDEQRDIPMEASPYGIAGWAENDSYVYIYDRYDIWKIDPAGNKLPVSITCGFGRKNMIRLHYEKTDPEEKFIPDGKIFLHGTDERNKSEGYLMCDTKNIAIPELLIMSDNHFSGLKKAKDAEVLVWRKENCETFPDIWTGDLNFKNINRLSDGNPQQEKFLWVKNQLVHWTSFSGEDLSGILYLPEDFDPSKKYPMIVYFYERSSDQLNRYSVPSPSRSVINKTFYASNGYLIFVPDITYRTGYPGESAFNAVVSGTNFLINAYIFIDKKKIGIQGQSWGGYQTAYLVTRTSMFAAAMAGAPVSNMTSAYGGIRWETGLSRMFQYEHTQSRIGGTLWEKPMQYLENSPLFHAPDITTPLLIMHNDNDGAVPWYQGIEFYIAMRRLQKPAWLLSYNNEPHNLKKESWADRMDLTYRMKQFFDHYLMDKPMPDWMKNGLPAIDKGKRLGY